MLRSGLVGRGDRLTVVSTRNSVALLLVTCFLCGCTVFTNNRPDFDRDGWDDELDCAPSDPERFPGQDDPVGDGIDSNCDGLDGIDADGDGFAAALSGGIDCNDSDPDIYPGALDPVDESEDSDCDGHEGTDSDGDGYASLLSGGEDCDDEDAAVNPLAEDVANDGIDNDCDGVLSVDSDGDGFLADQDCNDQDALVFPGAEEPLDGIDNDCDELIDEQTAAFDDDGDGSCEGVDLDNDGVLDCRGDSQPGDCDDDDPALNLSDQDGDGFSTCAGDCNDFGGTSFPGSIEFCDGTDNDCDGTIPAQESDQDGDGLWGCMGDCNDDPADPAAVETHPLDLDGDGYSTCNTPPDCNDNDPSVHPAALDPVDPLEIDANCDGIDGVDRDGDGFASLASGGGDCNDDPVSALAVDTWPGASDSVQGGVDNNCDGIPGVDLDGDGYASVASGGDDCDDSVALTWPGAPEQCDSADNDCDCGGDSNGDGVDCGSGDIGVDEGTQDDEDGDGELSCQGDCDNQDATIYSTAPELCDGLDNDCDGVLPGDEADLDQDGSRQCDDDCDDSDPLRSSLATEICDFVDNDCDCGGDSNGDGIHCGAGDVGVDDSCLVCDEEVFVAGALSIQGAIDSAASGDVICIGPGTWSEALTVNQPISLVGTAGRVLTVIDAGGTGTTLTIQAYNQAPSLLRGLTFSGGDGTAGMAPGLSNAGGLLIVSDVDLESVIIENNSSNYEGGIKFYAGECNLSQVIVRNNSANNNTAGVGALDITGTWQDVLILDNEADQGTGGLALVNSSITATNLEIRGNRALSQNGGGALIEGGNSSFDDLRVIGNDAALSGGGLLLSPDSTLQISGALIQGNRSLGGSSTGGGGVHIVTSTASSAGQIEIEGSTISGNSSFAGGGLFQGGGTLNLSDVVVSQNQTTSPGVGGGAGLYLTGSTSTLLRLLVADNEGTGSQFLGGGLYATQQELTLSQSTFSGNAARTGGGIYLSGTSNYSLSHLELLDNTAVEGGGLATTGSATVNFDHGRIVGNTAAITGGGMYLSTSATIGLSHLSVVGNEAINGGAVATVASSSSSNTVFFDNSDFSGNTASGSAPGLLNAQASYDPGISSCNAFENAFLFTGTIVNFEGFLADPLLTGNTSLDSQFLADDSHGLVDPLDWDLHLQLGSPLIDQASGTDSDGGPADIGMFGGNAQWDLDGDGYILWWQPGPYDSATYPGLGLDCDDGDPAIYPGSGC